MPNLYKTSCNTDWKGRPTHTLTLVATGTKEELLQKMDEDVAAWQADDILCDQEEENEDAADEEREPETVPNVWEQENVRWEMSRDDQTKGREFASACSDGGFWSLVYHIVD